MDTIIFSTYLVHQVKGVKNALFIFLFHDDFVVQVFLKYSLHYKLYKFSERAF